MCWICGFRSIAFFVFLLGATSLQAFDWNIDVPNAGPFVTPCPPIGCQGSGPAQSFATMNVFKRNENTGNFEAYGYTTPSPLATDTDGQWLATASTFETNGYFSAGRYKLQIVSNDYQYFDVNDPE